MTSKALVGPLPTITFGSWPNYVRQAYTPPKNTLDLRHAACTDHHPACDCREARFAEDRSEYRHIIDGFKQAAAETLRGHRLFDWGNPIEQRSNPMLDTYLHGNGPLACRCTGCQLFRASGEWIDCDANGVVR